MLTPDDDTATQEAPAAEEQSNTESTESTESNESTEQSTNTDSPADQSGGQPDNQSSENSEQPEGTANPPADNTPQQDSQSSGQSTDGYSDFRKAILAQLDKWAGAVEGTDHFDKDFMAPSVIADQRKAAGKQGITYTTCIAFQQRVLNDAAAAVSGSKVHTNIVGTLAESRAKQIDGAWHDGTPGGTDRPTPGDIYLLAFKDTPAMFSHVGYIKSIEVNSDGTETWTTVDGGQGVAGKYDADGNVTQAGKEKLAEVHRTYYPDTDLIKGEANQGGALRLLKGWVDIDKLVD